MLKKYKLIKKFPNSPDVGTEIIFKKGITFSNTYCANTTGQSYWYYPEDVENYPEFWEEVMEKKSFITTEDKVKIFEGDIVWFISRNLNKEDWKFPLATTVSKDTLFREHHIYFASEKAAKQYIEDNKPIYSKKQAIKMLQKFDSDVNQYEDDIMDYEKYLI